MCPETGGYVGKVSNCKDCNYVDVMVVEADDAMIEAIRADCERERSQIVSDRF